MSYSRKARFGGWLALLLLSLSLSGMARSKALISQSVGADALVTLRGNVHPLAQAKYDQGVAPDSLSMKRMLLVLKRDVATEKALSAAVEAQHNPKSPQYHKWLTPKQFRESFAPAQSDIDVITNWLGAQGFSEIKLSASGSVIEFSGSAAAVRNAFHTEIHKYNVNGELHWANATNPKIPASLAPAITGVVSLHNFERKSLHKDIGLFSFDKKRGVWSKSDAKPAKGGIQPNYTATTTSGSNYYAFGPGDFNTIYNVKPLWDAGYDGAGQEIAIVGRSAITTADVDAFRAAFGLPATKLNTVLAGDAPDHNGAEGESLLDIQWSGAIAKNATIDYVVAASTSTTDGIDIAALYAVDNNVAPILSVSYGMCELGLGTAGNEFYKEIWRQAAAEGITVLVASGDGSAATCDQGYNAADYGLTINGISSTPYNVSVGGTDFNDFGGANGARHTDYWNATNDPTTRASALSYIPEMVWNDSCGNKALLPVLGFADAESACNSDEVYVYGLMNVAGTGGGVSSCTVSTDADPSTCEGGYDKPRWQSAAGVPDDGKRDVPDLSLFSADGLTGSFLLYCMSSNTPNGVCNYDDSDNLQYMGAGGTSFATPAFAGVMALVNQKTGQRQGNANYVLYSLARGQFGTASAPLTSALSACSSEQGANSDPSCIFHDVITGDNSVPCPNGTLNCSVTYPSDQYGVTSGYDATVGYDPTTGLGSINAANLVNGWAQAAQLAPSKTTLSMTPPSNAYGASFSYSVTAAPATGSGTPTGTVIILADGSTIASVDLTNGAGSGSFNTLSAGKHSITASYVSDGLYASSVSDAISVTVAQASSKTTLALYEVNPLTGASSKSNTIHYGSKVLAAAAVSGVSGLATPSGSVQFASTGADAQSSTLDSNGQASATLAQLAVGASESITANYAGDVNYTASASSALSFSVVKANTFVRLAANTSYLVGDGSIALTATAYAYSNGAKPSGQLVLNLNGVSYAAQDAAAGVDPITGGVAMTASFTVPSSALASGSNVFTASFAGDANYAAANSSVLIVGHSATNPTSSVTLSAPTSGVTTQQSVAIQATVKVNGFSASAGSVVFYDNGAKLEEAQIVRASNDASAVGVATIHRRFAAGAHSITASFSGYGVVPTATAAPLSLTVTGVQSTSAELSVTANQLHDGNYDFTASVAGHGVTSPTGSLSLQETTTVATLATADIDPSAAVIHYGDQKKLILNQSVEYLAVGDLNNDGIPDIVIRKIGSVNCFLDVYIGLGDGKYAEPVEYTVGNASRGHEIAIVDLNGDGVADVLTVNQGDNNVSVLLGNGDGTLQPAYSVALGQKGPINLRVVDVNHDGIPDILTVSVADSSVAVLAGVGDGSFLTPMLTTLDLLPEMPAFADINSDGNVDIVYTSMIDYPSLLHVATGNGDGSFTLASSTIDITDNAYIRSLSLSDVNGDGNVDAIMANGIDGHVIVEPGDGKGGFGAPAMYIGGVNQPVITNAIAVDLNNDGKPDLAVIDDVNSNVNILLNNGDGTFGAATGFFPTIPLASEIYVADLNGDGAPDLLQTSQLDGASYASIIFGGRKATVKMRNITPDGARGVLQQGVAIYNGDAAYSVSTSSPVSFYGSGKQSTPQILWTPTSSTWSVNMPLGAGVLDASTYGDVAGSFAYTAQLAGGQPVAVTSTSALSAKGGYTLKVVFTPTDASSYTTASATTTLTIVDPDFTLGVANGGNSSVTLSVGGSSSATIAVGSLNGFYGYVNLSCATTAPGIACAINPAAVATGGTASVSLTATGASTTTNVRGAARSVGFIAGGAAASFLLFTFMSFGVRRKRLLIVAALLAILSFSFGCGSSDSAQATSLTLNTANAKIASGGSSALTANLSVNGKAINTGTVNFYDGSTLIGSSTVSKGVASFNASGLSVGVHSLTAQYAGDGKHLASTSNVVSQAVTGKTTVTITAGFGSVTHTSTLDVNLQ